MAAIAITAAGPLTGWGRGPEITRLLLLLVTSASVLTVGVWIDHVLVPLVTSYRLGVSAGVRTGRRRGRHTRRRRRPAASSSRCAA